MTDFEDPFALLAQERGAKTFGFATVGDAVHGLVLSGRIDQDRKYEPRSPGNGALLYWDANKRGVITEKAEGNKPVTYVTTILKAFEPTDDDDGRRAVRANKPRMKEAIKNATVEAGAKMIAVGGYLWVKHDESIPSKSGGSPAKGFTARYWTPEQVANDEVPDDLETSGSAKRDEGNPFA